MKLPAAAPLDDHVLSVRFEDGEACEVEMES